MKNHLWKQPVESGGCLESKHYWIMALSARHGHRLSYVHPPCALLWACKEGHAGVVKLLLERGADVECTHEGEFQQILAE